MIAVHGSGRYMYMLISHSMLWYRKICEEKETAVLRPWILLNFSEAEMISGNAAFSRQQA